MIEPPTIRRRLSGDEARYGFAYLRYLAGERDTEPSHVADHWKVPPAEARRMQIEVEQLVAAAADRELPLPRGKVHRGG